MKTFIRLLIITLGVLSLTACELFAPVDNAPQPTALRPIKPTLAVNQEWILDRRVTPSKHPTKLTPTVKNDNVFIADANGHVRASRAASGEQLWRTKINNTITAGPSLGDRDLYVATESGEIVALSQKTGKILWVSRLPNLILAAPAYGEDRVFGKTIDGDLVALNADNGKVLWTYHHASPTFILRAQSSPVVAQGRVIAGFADAKVVALHVTNGEILWQKRISIPHGVLSIQQMVDIDADPIVKAGTVYVASYQGKIAALDLTNGQLRWQHDISTFTGLAVSDRRVFVSDAKSRVWAFDRETGLVDWKMAQLTYRHITAPILTSNAVVVGDREGYLHWLSRENGAELARVFTGKEGITAPPAALGKNVFVLTRTGRLEAFS